ncbi:GyrI-like domain-containing protein [Eisenbergiella sp.]
MDRIPNVVTPVRVVGFWQPGGVYFTGVEVSEAGVSDGFVIKNLPESIFAKFREERRGTVSGPGGYAYNQWLPTSGYWVNEALPGDFEIFEDMEHCGANDVCDILIPIRPLEKSVK